MRVVIGVLIGLITASGAFAEGAGKKRKASSVLEQSGLLGAWSVDCSKDHRQQIFVREGVGYSRLVAGQKEIRTARIVSVEHLDGETVKMTLAEVDNKFGYATYKVGDGTIQVLDVRDSLGTVVVENGKTKSGYVQAPMTRCETSTQVLASVTQAVPQSPTLSTRPPTQSVRPTAKASGLSGGLPTNEEALQCVQGLVGGRTQIGPGVLDCNEYLALESVNIIDRSENGPLVDALAEINLRAIDGFGGTSIVSRLCTHYSWNDDIVQGQRIMLTKILSFQKFTNRSVCHTKTMEPLVNGRVFAN